MKIISIIILFTLALLLQFTSFAQQQSDTSKVLVTFSEPMSHEGIFDINNYHIYKEDSTLVKIYKVGVAKGDSVVVLFTEKQTPKASYKLIISNLKDKSGNIISSNRKMANY
ncbi:MAG TPA: hypothetical protein PKD67_01520 [Ignavibacteriaceae bacterium]|nr:hypothetical protein [Ignavibacteriaceae bacterium]